MFALPIVGQNVMPPPNDPRLYYSNYNNGNSSAAFWIGNPAGDPEAQFLNLLSAWAITTGDPAIKVAVLSNGTDWNQQDMPADNYLGYNFADGNNNTTATCTPFIAYSGTNVNSVIFSKTNNNSGIFGVAGGWGGTAGVTPVVYKITPDNATTINTLWAGNNNTVSNLISSLNSAVAKGVKVILIPHGITGASTNDQTNFINTVDAILSDPCTQLTIIAAVGDWDPHTSHDVMFPGTYDPIITVGGVNESHYIYDFGAGGSCYGQHLDFVTGYASPVNSGDPCLQNADPYNCKFSSSNSAAQLAGVVALMYSVNPNLTQADVFDILKQSCYKTPNYTDWDANGWSPHVGYGFPNAKTALELAIDYGGEDINYSQTWTTNRTKRSINIKPGVTLTLSGITLSMWPGSTITVEPGGKLIVNSSTITNACLDKMWKGINVWGNTTANQYPDANGNYQQGYLELNNSTIEHAIFAANLWKPNDYSKTGGILKANNSTFRNNTNAIHACYYKNTHPLHPNTEVNYSGTCTRCNFEITTGYIPEKTFYKHVDLAEIKGFSFLSCDFSLAKNVKGVSDWNQAIAAYSAGFNVNALCNSNVVPCNDYDRSTFTGFQWAINAKVTKLLSNTFYVNRADFTDNIYGIYVNDVDHETVINCDFQVGYNPGNGNCTTNASYGIYLEESSGFAIEDNQFSKLSGAPTSVYNGILVSNCESADQIYRNTFTGLSYANLAQLKNFVEPHYYNGLNYFCNTNNNNWADFYVIPDGDDTKYSGISDSQGSDNLVTGNKFSQSANTRWHFYNGGDYLVGYYYNANQPDEDPYDNPDPNLSKIYYVTDKGKQLSNSCPSHYGGGGGISVELNNEEKTARESEFAEALTSYNNIKTLYDNLVDGGSTSQTLTDIETAQPQDMWALRSELLGASPHLSIEVLKKVADRTDVFPPSAIFDILAANPDELRSNELISYLENTTDPLPDYMINILRSVAEGSTYKTVLQQQMALYNREKTNAANDIIRSILNTEETDFDELRNWLDNLGGSVADRQIIATYLQQNNYTAALNLATMQPQLYELSEAEIAANNALIQLIGLYQTLYNEGRQLDALKQTEKDMLTGIAALYPSEACAIARGVLSTYYGETYDECFSIPEIAAYKKGQLTPEVSAQIYGMKIEVNPNPATNWAAFDYRLPDFESAGLFEIADIAGHVVLSIELHDAQGQYLLDTRTFACGMYFYTLTSGKARKTGKLTIIK